MILQIDAIQPRTHLKSGCPKNVPGIFYFHPEKSGRTNFRPELFWIFQISTGKFLGFSTFAPTFFVISNFRPEIFLVFKISRQKKSTGFLIPVPGWHCRIYDGYVS